MMRENKFDLSINFVKLISDNYLQEFYDFLDSTKNGRIWNGTIEKKKCKSFYRRT
jgi:hypothetical protein